MQGKNNTGPVGIVALGPQPGGDFAIWTGAHLFRGAVLYLDVFEAEGGGIEVLFGLVSMTMAFIIGEILADSALWEVRIDGFTE